jgi:hypothetical protein
MVERFWGDDGTSDSSYSELALRGGRPFLDSRGINGRRGDDRSSLLHHTEQTQGHDLSRRGWASLPDHSGQPRERRPVQIGVLAVQGKKLEDFPHVKRWFNAIAAGPTTKRAYELAKRINTQPSANDEASQKILFGQIAASVNV